MEDYDPRRRRAPPSRIQDYFRGLQAPAPLCAGIVGHLDHIRDGVGVHHWQALPGGDKERRVNDAFLLESFTCLEYTSDDWGKSVAEIKKAATDRENFEEWQKKIKELKSMQRDGNRKLNFKGKLFSKAAKDAPAGTPNVMIRKGSQVKIVPMLGRVRTSGSGREIIANSQEVEKATPQAPAPQPERGAHPKHTRRPVSDLVKLMERALPPPVKNPEAVKNNDLFHQYAEKSRDSVSSGVLAAPRPRSLSGTFTQTVTVGSAGGQDQQQSAFRPQRSASFSSLNSAKTQAREQAPLGDSLVPHRAGATRRKRSPSNLSKAPGLDLGASLQSLSLAVAEPQTQGGDDYMTVGGASDEELDSEPASDGEAEAPRRSPLQHHFSEHRPGLRRRKAPAAEEKPEVAHVLKFKEPQQLPVTPTQPVRERVELRSVRKLLEQERELKRQEHAEEEEEVPVDHAADVWGQEAESEALGGDVFGDFDMGMGSDLQEILRAGQRASFEFDINSAAPLVGSLEDDDDPLTQA